MLGKLLRINKKEAKCLSFFCIHDLNDQFASL